MTDRASQRLGAHAAMSAMVGVAVVLWRYPAAPFYPPCPIYRLLGVRCPGCGATRALAALLHGHWMQALRWNALFVVALPFLLAYAGMAYRRVIVEVEFCWPRMEPVAIFGCLALVLSFALARGVLGI